jgi:hypothetical protein
MKKVLPVLVLCFLAVGSQNTFVMVASDPTASKQSTKTGNTFFIIINAKRIKRI